MCIDCTLYYIRTCMSIMYAISEYMIDLIMSCDCHDHDMTSLLSSFQSWFDFASGSEDELREKIIAQEREQHVLRTLHQVFTTYYCNHSLPYLLCTCTCVYNYIYYSEDLYHIHVCKHVYYSVYNNL